MTTSSWSSAIDHSSDATFRAWGSDISTHLAAIGLVQTADTGQINWTTATRPGVNTVAGYEIWRFNDSLQGSAPIFFKLEYGTDSLATRPMVFITVGTGSNGSGTITGTSSTRTKCSQSVASIISAVANYPSYACAVPGGAWIAFKVGAGNTTPVGSSIVAFGIFRYNDPDGTPNGNGYVVYCGSGSTTLNPMAVQSVRTVSPATVFAVDTNGCYVLIPHADNGSSLTLDTGDMQVFSHWAPTRRSMQLNLICSYLGSEMSAGTTFSTKVMGTSNRTYIATGGGLGYGSSSGSGGSGGTVSRNAAIWE